MNKQDILTLYKYNQWTTAKILSCTANVTQEQFIAPASFPHGGLRGTLVHALFAEWLWRNRWEGISPTTRFKPEDFPDPEALRARWMYEEEKLMAFVEGLTNESLNCKFNYHDTKGQSHERVLWQAMAHVVNHGTQHKTEAAAMLTELGQSPGDIDLIYYLIEKE
jgi:uncharacterized damage-inducible protein DinB